jgi:hypothetical protein
MYDIEFNSLLCLNNMPIKRYADWLMRNDKLSEYMQLLVGRLLTTVLSCLCSAVTAHCVQQRAWGSCRHVV